VKVGLVLPRVAFLDPIQVGRAALDAIAVWVLGITTVSWRFHCMPTENVSHKPAGEIGSVMGTWSNMTGSGLAGVTGVGCPTQLVGRSVRLGDTWQTGRDSRSG
jgi:hypothetical protein